MKFSLTILGSSSGVPTASRNTTAHVLNVHERFFLIDCGEGTQIQFRKYRIRFGRVHQIFISHLHSDHILGLFGYLATQTLIGRKKEIDVFGPPDLERFVRNHFSLFPESLLLPVKFHPLDLSGPARIFEDKAVEVTSFPVNHRVPTWGFVFTEKLKGRNYTNLKPRSYAFCTDTLFEPSLASVFEGCDLLYHEATYGHKELSRATATYHSTAKQAAEMAKLANARQLVLGHFSARYKDTTPLLEEAREIFPNTIEATDGLTIDVSFP
ncbi:MAG: ribonuclease Z [Bacteroidales bacterium]|nr:ribonuclease Z [Bacteroidales bacterium]